MLRMLQRGLAIFFYMKRNRKRLSAAHALSLSYDQMLDEEGGWCSCALSWVLTIQVARYTRQWDSRGQDPCYHHVKRVWSKVFRCPNLDYDSRYQIHSTSHSFRLSNIIHYSVKVRRFLGRVPTPHNGTRALWGPRWSITAVCTAVPHIIIHPSWSNNFAVSFDRG